MNTPALTRLGEVSKQYERACSEFAELIEATVRADVAYRRTEAKVWTENRLVGASGAEADRMTGKDDAVLDAYEAFKLADGVERSMRARLRQLESAIEVGRTFAVADRRADEAHANTSGHA